MYTVHKSQTCNYQKQVKSVMEKDSNDIKQAVPASANTAMEIMNSPGMFALGDSYLTVLGHTIFKHIKSLLL